MGEKGKMTNVSIHTHRWGENLAEAKFGMAKCGTTKLYHILLRWYVRTEAICLGVVVAGHRKQASIILEIKISWCNARGCTEQISVAGTYG